MPNKANQIPYVMKKNHAAEIWIVSEKISNFVLLKMMNNQEKAKTDMTPSSLSGCDSDIQS